MSVLPEPLVTVATYGSPELAEPAKARLDANGVTAYLGGGYYRRHSSVELRVPEAQVERALRLLGLEDAPTADREPAAGRPRCPDCGSDQSREIPPYAFYSLIGALGAGFLVCLLVQSPVGAAVLLPGWLLAMWFSRYAGKRRCAACGRTWKP